MDRLYQMRLFVRVVETGSFSAVARELGTIQPTISKQLTALEDHLGVRLLNRTTRQLSTTEAGRKYYDRCRHILDEITDLEGSLTVLQNSPTGLLRVNAPVAFGQLYMCRWHFASVGSTGWIDLTLNDRHVDRCRRHDVANWTGVVRFPGRRAEHGQGDAGLRGQPSLPAGKRRSQVAERPYFPQLHHL
jgi:hypothetical protein